MNREQFFEVIERAARALPDEEEIIVIGSQAVHAWLHDPPERVALSNEVDIAPIDDADDTKAMHLNWVLGEFTEFNEETGVYAEGIGIDLFTAPTGWVGRARVLDVARPDGSVLRVVCPEPHDICVSKLIANRPKDEEFVEALARETTIDLDRIEYLLTGTHARPAELSQASAAVGRIRRHLERDEPARVDPEHRGS